jgi:hypothetical protein
MKFDLSSLPPAASILQATLYAALVDGDTFPEATYVVSAHKVIGRDAVIATATGFTFDGVTSWTPNALVRATPLAQADISTPHDARAIRRKPPWLQDLDDHDDGAGVAGGPIEQLRCCSTRTRPSFETVTGISPAWSMRIRRCVRI